MNSLLVAALMLAGYYVAYHTYGKFLARKIFKLDPEAVCPSNTLKDDYDFVPTRKHILFGHHYTSIAGLGPISGSCDCNYLGLGTGCDLGVLWRDFFRSCS